MFINRPRPPFDTPVQAYPGVTSLMDPLPDHGEESYRGSGRLQGKVALVTGGDSGIGRAVAIAFAREGADVVIAYLDESQDAHAVAELVVAAGRRVLTIEGDISDPAHAVSLVDRTIDEFGQIDVIVNNAAFHKEAKTLAEISIEDWRQHFEVNVHGLFYIVRAAEHHLKAGASIINSSSMNAKAPAVPQLAYSASKAAIINFTTGLAAYFAPRGIRANAVLPGPVWTPLVAASKPPEEARDFGLQVPMQRPGQPVELASAYVYLASDESSYTSGAMIAVAGGAPAL